MFFYNIETAVPCAGQLPASIVHGYQANHLSNTRQNKYPGATHTFTYIHYYILLYCSYSAREKEENVYINIHMHIYISCINRLSLFTTAYMSHYCVHNLIQFFGFRFLSVNARLSIHRSRFFFYFIKLLSTHTLEKKVFLLLLLYLLAHYDKK